MNTTVTGPMTTTGRLDAALLTDRDRIIHIRRGSKERNHVQSPATVPIRTRARS